MLFDIFLAVKQKAPAPGSYRFSLILEYSKVPSTFHDYINSTFCWLTHQACLKSLDQTRHASLQFFFIFIFLVISELINYGRFWESSNKNQTEGRQFKSQLLNHHY